MWSKCVNLWKNIVSFVNGTAYKYLISLMFVLLIIFLIKISVDALIILLFDVIPSTDVFDLNWFKSNVLLIIKIFPFAVLMACTFFALVGWMKYMLFDLGR